MSTPENTGSQGASSSATLAIVLWVLVVAALTYGVFKTVDTALALFGV